LNIHENNENSESSDSDCSIGSSDHMSDQVSPTSPNSAYKQNNFEDQSPEKLHDVTLALDK